MDKMRYVQSLPPGAPFTPRHAASTLWAMTRTAQIFRSMPPADRETMGRKVLHLDVAAVWDRAGQETLWKLTAKAIAEGADASDHDLLAARHLQESGAFAPAALLRQGPNVQGVNWSGTPAPAGVDWGRVRRIAHGPNGTVTQPVQPVWTGPDRPMPLLSVVEVDWAGSLVLHLPGRAPVEVSEGEFLALMAMDPALNTVPLNIPVLFLTTGPGVLPDGLLQRFSQRTGRPAFGYDAPMMLNAPDAATPLVILALLDPATKNPGQWTGTVRQFAAPGTTTDAALTVFGTAAATSAPQAAQPLAGPEGAAPDPSRPSWPAPQARRESGVGTFHFAPGTVTGGAVRTGTGPGGRDERSGIGYPSPARINATPVSPAGPENAPDNAAQNAPDNAPEADTGTASGTGAASGTDPGWAVRSWRPAGSPGAVRFAGMYRDREWRRRGVALEFAFAGHLGRTAGLTESVRDAVRRMHGELAGRHGEAAALRAFSAPDAVAGNPAAELERLLALPPGPLAVDELMSALTYASYAGPGLPREVAEALSRPAGRRERFAPGSAYRAVHDSRGLRRVGGDRGPALRLLRTYAALGASPAQLHAFRDAVIAWAVPADLQSLPEILSASHGLGLGTDEERDLALRDGAGLHNWAAPPRRRPTHPLPTRTPRPPNRSYRHIAPCTPSG